MSIVPFLNGRLFGPKDIQALSTALENVCKILNLADQAQSGRELLAKKFIALAHQGERNPTILRDRRLKDIAYAGGE
jgi:hypothetical protein